MPAITYTIFLSMFFCLSGCSNHTYWDFSHIPPAERHAADDGTIHYRCIEDYRTSNDTIFAKSKTPDDCALASIETVLNFYDAKKALGVLETQKRYSEEPTGALSLEEILFLYNEKLSIFEFYSDCYFYDPPQRKEYRLVYHHYNHLTRIFTYKKKKYDFTSIPNEIELHFIQWIQQGCPIIVGLKGDSHDSGHVMVAVGITYKDSIGAFRKTDILTIDLYDPAGNNGKGNIESYDWDAYMADAVFAVFPRAEIDKESIGNFMFIVDDYFPKIKRNSSCFVIYY